LAAIQSLQQVHMFSIVLYVTCIARCWSVTLLSFLQVILQGALCSN
jgi:hypothetical protein